MTLRRSLAAPALLSLLAFACERAPDPPSDPYLAELRARLEALRPEVEREIGRPLPDVEILVLPREKIAEENIPLARDLLSRIENGPTGADLEAEVKQRAAGSAEFALASVLEGRIRFPDPSEGKSIHRAFLDLLPASEFKQDPRALDVILLHELIHVHQHRHLVPPAFLKSMRSRADLEARRAVCEGHAEHLTRKIAARIGLADTYDRYIKERTDPLPSAKEFARKREQIDAQDSYFPYLQGAKFIEAVVERLGYDEAMREIVRSPPTLGQVSRPEEYLGKSEPSRWGPVAEDLRRWLVRERGDADLDVIALPYVRAMAGDAAEGFREGFRVASRLDAGAFVLVCESEAAARELHAAWTKAIEAACDNCVGAGLFTGISLVRKSDEWTIHYAWLSSGCPRRTVIREGNLIVDLMCNHDSDLEQGAERLARRALRFLRDAAWREAWLRGDRDLLKSEDPGLRLAAVTRMKSYVPDEDWEVRWAGRFSVATDEKRDEAERTAAIVGAIEDPSPAVVARGLRADSDLSLGEVPWPLIREHLRSKEVAIRREAYRAMNDHIAWLDRENLKASEGRPSEAVDFIDAALGDEDVTVRYNAVDCLHRCKDAPRLAAVLRKALADDVERVRSNALFAINLCELKLPELVPDLVRLLDDDPVDAARALGHIGEAAAPAVPRLRELLVGKSRAAAAGAIWFITKDPEPLFKVVRESVAEGSPEGISEAGKMGVAAQPVVSDVVKALAHENLWTRSGAARALGSIGGPPAREALSQRLKVERDPTVVDAIRKALDACGQPSEPEPAGPAPR
ncbi:MAG: HEAT repeat domain-containing protein [Planctomycetes bacterium]|nr:HEAT repeat domain-containing protein [Planctomycetota bacterium]